MKTLKIAIEQLNFTVGDISNNARRIMNAAENSKADLLVFPELSLSGYPPEDLLLREAFHLHLKQCLDELIEFSRHTPALLIAYPEKDQDKIYNTVSLISAGKILASHRKLKLPNYTVFDEARYFTAGQNVTVVEFKNIKLGLLICEDLWQEGPIQQTTQNGAELIISVNASPFGLEQQSKRENLIQQHALRYHVPIVYINLVGGQDELVFDGASFVMNTDGKIAAQARPFSEDSLLTEFELDTRSFKLGTQAKSLTRIEQMYQALCLGLKDYLAKNGFKQALLGLSGGIDSALTLAIAVDALGAENVTAVLMPSRHTASISNEDAIQEVQALGVKYHILAIEQPYQSFLELLHPLFANTQIDLTEQNIQARCRAIILMALSNKFASLVLTTSNKSELAVGYSTLYGDMAGGFSVLKDVLKTDVYRLARYRNSLSPVIPTRVIERPPTAELADNQLDQDTLPPYEILDELIKLHIEQELDREALVARGFDQALVEDVIRRIKLNEYKRRQAPIGIRLGEKAFGKDRRYPVANKSMS